MRSTQLLTQWMLGVVSLDIKWLKRENGRSSSPNADAKIELPPLSMFALAWCFPKSYDGLYLNIDTLVVITFVDVCYYVASTDRVHVYPVRGVVRFFDGYLYSY
jgi:hypothetical protein